MSEVPEVSISLCPYFGSLSFSSEPFSVFPICQSRAPASLGLYATLGSCPTLGLYAAFGLLTLSAYTPPSGYTPPLASGARRTTFVRPRDPGNRFPQLPISTKFPYTHSAPCEITSRRSRTSRKILFDTRNSRDPSHLCPPRRDYTPTASALRGVTIHSFRASRKYFSLISAPRGSTPYYFCTSWS